MFLEHFWYIHSHTFMYEYLHHTKHKRNDDLNKELQSQPQNSFPSHVENG